MSNDNGHRWSKFWWQDHQGDETLKLCSLAARGYWIEMLAVMHKATPTGHLLINGKPAPIRLMAITARCSEKEAKRCEAELEEFGVFSRTADGTIYSRRMVKDAKAAEQAKTWGREGGNPNLKAKPNGAEHPPPLTRGVNPTPLTPTHKADPYPGTLRPPLTRFRQAEVESEKEPEEEKKEREVKDLASVSPVWARVADACETPPEGTYGDEPTPNATQIAVQNIAQKVTRSLVSSGSVPQGKRAQRTPMEQVAGVLYGEVIDPEGPRRGPVDPQRTVAQQFIDLGLPVPAHLVSA
jgi:uncharacterized protein YdaU (DUF1376 family)